MVFYIIYKECRAVPYMLDDALGQNYTIDITSYPCKNLLTVYALSSIRENELKIVLELNDLHTRQ